MNIADDPTQVSGGGSWREQDVIRRIPIIVTGAAPALLRLSAHALLHLSCRPGSARHAAGSGTFAKWNYSISQAEASYPSWRQACRSTRRSCFLSFGLLLLAGLLAGSHTESNIESSKDCIVISPPLQATTSARCMRRSSAAVAWRSSTGSPTGRTCSPSCSRCTRWDSIVCNLLLLRLEYF